MSGPTFPVYQHARRSGFLSPNEKGYEYYVHLHNKLPKEHDFHDPSPIRYPPYTIDKMVTEGDKYMTISQLDPHIPPIYVGSMWDHIEKEQFTNQWWEAEDNATNMLSNPPFNDMWIEFDVPNNRPQDGYPDRVPMACLFHKLKADEEDRPDFAVVTVFIASNVAPTMDADTHHRDELLIPMAIGGVQLGNDFGIPRVGWSIFHWGLAIDCILDGLNIVGLLTKFLNCRNVDLVEVLPATIASNPKKRRKRLSNPSRTKYRVVHVEPMKRKQAVREAPATPGSTRRQHMRRGHFKTYSPDAPLFGKVAGTFWWGPAVCGEGSYGMISQSWDMSSLVVKPEEIDDDK